MSFTRCNPGGWSVGSKLTSVQMNRLDIDHANALDKTVAGDTLSGSIAMEATASINTSYAGNIYIGAADSLQVSVAGGINLQVSGALQSTVGGAIQSATGGGIQATIRGGIRATTAGGLQTGVTGGFELTGSSSDWPTFGAAGGSPRTRVIWMPCDCIAGATLSATATTSNALGQLYTPQNLAGSPYNVGFSGLTTQVVGSASNVYAYAYYFPMRQFLHNGATLTSAVLTVTPATHTGLPSGALIRFGIFQTTETGLSPQALLSTNNGFVTDPSANYTAYNLHHPITLTPDQNNVIDTTQYGYCLIILDECGTSNTQLENQMIGVQLNYGSITNMAFP